jgi:hypothetical protein
MPTPTIITFPYRNTVSASVAGPDEFLPDPDYRKRPDPDPDPNKFSANFFLKIFLMKICSKKYLYEPKS